MSFLKISDPAKRDAIVKEYLDLKKNIRGNLLRERTGELELQADLSKFYKPITETQKATAKEITEGLKPIREGIEKLPEALQPIKDDWEEEEEDEKKRKKRKQRKNWLVNERILIYIDLILIKHLELKKKVAIIILGANILLFMIMIFILKRMVKCLLEQMVYGN